MHDMTRQQPAQAVASPARALFASFVSLLPGTLVAGMREDEMQSMDSTSRHHWPMSSLQSSSGWPGRRGRDLSVPPGDLLAPLRALARAQRPAPWPTAYAGPEDEKLSVVPAWPALGRAEAALSSRDGIALAAIAAALAVLLLTLLG